jgi:hypothetical protein
MRRERIWPRTIEEIVIAPERRRIDSKGNPIAVGRDSLGRTLEIVLALDDPGYVITVIARRKRR